MVNKEVVFMLTINIVNDGKVKACKQMDKEVNLVFNEEYEIGDQIQITFDKINSHYMLQLDDAIGPCFVYINDYTLLYEIPFGEKKVCYSPKSFYGKCHIISVRHASIEEIKQYKNLCLNKYDQNISKITCYPHAVANVETRGESVFAAKNAINGNCLNESHGEWPYESWGINRDDNAKIKVEFGRFVHIDKIVLYTRADFPHDNWWTNVTVTFSDNSSFKWDLEKTDKGQVITFDSKKIEWFELSNLIKSEDPSPFPALSQLEAYGAEEGFNER